MHLGMTCTPSARLPHLVLGNELELPRQEPAVGDRRDRFNEVVGGQCRSRRHEVDAEGGAPHHPPMRDVEKVDGVVGQEATIHECHLLGSDVGGEVGAVGKR